MVSDILLKEGNHRQVILDDIPNFARDLALQLNFRDIVLMTGTLGAGKTTLVHFMLKSLGLSKNKSFSSPTFTICHHYDVPQGRVYHLDLYRLQSFYELEQMGLLDIILEDESAITFVEWGHKFPELETYFTKTIHLESVPHSQLERLIVTKGFKI